jgi:hypothetical protein
MNEGSSNTLNNSLDGGGIPFPRPVRYEYRDLSDGVESGVAIQSRRPSRSAYACRIERDAGPTGGGESDFFVARSKDRSWWILWERWVDDNEWTPKVYNAPIAACPTEGIDIETAAFWLLHDRLQYEARQFGLDNFLFGTGRVLSEEQLRVIKKETLSAAQVRRSIPTSRKSPASGST